MKTASGMMTAWQKGRSASALQITRFRAGQGVPAGGYSRNRLRA